MPRRPLPALLLAVALVASGEIARAEAPSDEAVERSRQRYQEAAQAYSEHRYKDAIDLFFAANRIAANPAYAYNIGLAYEELGDADNALLWYRNYLRDLPNAQDRPEIERRITTAEGRLRDRGVQQITILSTPTAATVAVDGERVGVTPWTGQLTPGKHKLELELRGYQDEAETFDLPSDHAIDYPVTLRKSGAAAPPKEQPMASTPPEEMGAETPPPEADGQRHGLARVRPLTWIAFGVGAAGLGSSVAFELMRSSSVKDARQAKTAIEGKDRYDRAVTDQTLSRVALAVGSAFAVAGGVLLYFDLKSHKSESSATTAAIGCGAAACGVAVHGSF
jgi:tetratricopeptide (TPR) repeat protein